MEGSTTKMEKILTLPSTFSRACERKGDTRCRAHSQTTSAGGVQHRTPENATPRPLGAAHRGEETEQGEDNDRTGLGGA